MLQVIQSNQTTQLLKHLIHAYKTEQAHVFDEFVVLVPSMVLGDWLQNSIADQLGISTLITNEFWGQYQWRLMQTVLENYNKIEPKNAMSIPEVAVLSTRVMQWQIFGYFLHHKTQIISEPNHPLYEIVSKLITANQNNSSNSNFTTTNTNKAQTNNDEVGFWQLSEQLAGVFNRYLTHRLDWLDIWSGIGQANNASNELNIAKLIKDKDTLTAQFSGTNEKVITPDWIIENYEQLQKAQCFLWQQLFKDVYRQRRNIETRFWQGIDFFAKQLTKKDFAKKLNFPKSLYLFTIQQLPLDEFSFIKRLSNYVDIKLLHYNPSKAYWADIVDKHWFTHQQIINPSIVYLREFGHTLLSRLGKQERETFATLSSLAGNEQYINDGEYQQVEWRNDFVDVVTPQLNTITNNTSLLHRLQQDVLDMDDKLTKLTFEQQTTQQVINNLQERQWQFDGIDNSLSIHSCHSLQRQLEVLRGMIAKWLNEPNSHEDKQNKETSSLNKRHISDIVVMLPEVDSNYDLISSVFVDGVGQDGLALPARVTGVVDRQVRQLWQAICGYYQLLGEKFSTFEATQFYDWLMLPAIYESHELTFEQITRACDLLKEAGFIRGFDEQHIKQRVTQQDTDYRFSFAYALDRLVMGLTTPNVMLTDCLYTKDWTEFNDEENSLLKPNHIISNSNMVHEKTVPLASVSLNDASIIKVLCDIFNALNTHRNEYFDKTTNKAKQQTAHEWLTQIENKVIHPYFAAFNQTRAMRSIFKAMNGLKANLRANYFYKQDIQQDKTANTDDSHPPSIKQLPFQLSFIIESIEKELESQQISAEQTGAITFARFGALRTLPFKLVVMLNMNLSEFPRQQKEDRYDLMKAGLARRGDRRSDDDDNGAFLDALLCAKQNCWIFYNGQSVTDANEHLPATPVSELIHFLTSEINWQWSETEVNNLSAIDKQIFEQNIREHIHSRLVTKHTALPFTDDVFFQPLPKEITKLNNQASKHQDVQDAASFEQVLANTLFNFNVAKKVQTPPAPIWTQVFKQLSTSNGSKNGDKNRLNKNIEISTPTQYEAIANLLTHSFGKPQSDWLTQLLPNNNATVDELLTTLNLPAAINIEHLSTQVNHTGKLYLRHNQVNISQYDDESTVLEPLKLNGLSNYALNDSLIEYLPQLLNINNTDDKIKPNYSKEIESFLFSPVLPAGIARQTTLTNAHKNLLQQIQNLGITLKNYDAAKGLDIDRTSIDSNYEITEVNEVHRNITMTIFGKPHTIEVNGLIPNCYGDKVDSSDANNNTKLSVKRWINILATKASGKHLIKFWLRHLFWQVVRNTSSQQAAVGDGDSIWQFASSGSDINTLKDMSLIKLPAIEQSLAKRLLVKWYIYANFAKHYPIIIMPQYAFTYLNKLIKANEDGSIYTPIGADFKGWSAPMFNKNNVNKTIYDSCSQHAIWSYILDDINDDTTLVNQALIDAVNTLAEPLFLEVYEALEGIA